MKYDRNIFYSVLCEHRGILIFLGFIGQMPLKGKVILLIGENHQKCLFMTYELVAELKGIFAFDDTQLK